MHEPVMLPEWMQERMVSDEAFAEAYHETLPHRRAMIKSTIARLHVLLGERRMASCSSATMLDSGMRSIVWDLRLNTFVVALPAGFASPSRLLATIVPAQLAGVQEIVVICLRPETDTGEASSIAPATLAALELAGVETCLELTPEEFQKLPGILEESGQWGAFATLESGCSVVTDSLSFGTESLDVHCWFDTPDSFALDDLLWLYGDDIALFCWGEAPEALPDCARRAETDFETFLSVDKFLALAPEERVKEISTSAQLACSPEALGMWLWPGLTPDAFFATRRILIG